MIDGVKKSLDYFTANFGALPAPAGAHPRVPALRALRAVVPQHHPVLRGASASSPDCDDDAEDIDYAFYVTAHEVAHQWWAHQVIGGERAGRDDAVRDDGAVLRADGDGEGVRPRQDAALPRVRARPLPAAAAAASGSRRCRCSLVENQPYIHYRKGSLVMYALRDEIGEDAAQPRAAPVRRGHAVPGAAVHRLARARRLLCAGGAARAAALPARRPVRDASRSTRTASTKATCATRRADGKYVVTLTYRGREAARRRQGQGDRGAARRLGGRRRLRGERPPGRPRRPRAVPREAPMTAADDATCR